MNINQFICEFEKHPLYEHKEPKLYGLGNHVSLKIEDPAIFVILNGVEVGVCTNNYSKLYNFLIRAICELVILEEYTVCQDIVRNISVYGLNGIKWSHRYSTSGRHNFNNITTVAMHILPAVHNASFMYPIKAFVHNHALCLSPFGIQDIAYKCNLDDPDGKSTFINILNEYLHNMVRYAGFKHTGDKMEPLPKIHHKKKRTSRVA